MKVTHLMISFLLAAVSIFELASCSIISDLAPSKPSNVRTKDWLVIPIFYRTNRAKTAKSKFIDYTEAPNNDGHYFGVKNIVVPLPDHFALPKDDMDKLGWQLLHVEKPVDLSHRPAVPQTCKIADREVSAPEIVTAFSSYRQSSDSDQVVVFVHGCCATFDTSLERAAKIAAVMQAPLVIYDWVSPTGFTRYLQNETLAEQEEDDCCQFLTNLETIIPASSTILMGHSMGAHFLDTALVRRFEREYRRGSAPKYRELDLCSPDMDARSYLNHNNAIVSNATQVRIFMSRDDGRLRTSARAHGNFPRLGRPESLLGDLCKTDGQQIIDVTEVGMGHELPFWVVADMHHKGKPAPEEGFSLESKGKNLFALRKQSNISYLPARGPAPIDDASCSCGPEENYNPGLIYE
ncbi:MAG: alpha/beta hydrolase [Cyanobacteria bacterium]|nr:alpha/beta hydrolase [Cyanobacteriota bacterium]